MWLLHLLPESFILFIVTCLLAVGFTGIIAGFFLKFIPFINNYRIPVQIVSIILFCTGIYWYGGYTTEMIWRDKVKEVEAQIKDSEKEAKVITKTIVKDGKEKIVIVNRQVDVIKKEIEVHKEIINGTCVLTQVAVDAYNQAVTGDTGPLTVTIETPKDDKNK
jgi:hypothetical protein